MDRQLRTWDYPNRLPNMLFDLSPALKTEMRIEYLENLRDLNDIFDAEGVSEHHCLEMMATSMFCQRRAISCETSALDLDFVDMAKNQQLRRNNEQGFTAAEQTAIANYHVSKEASFYQFLLRYKLAQVRLFDASLRQLAAFKAARKKYARIPVEDGDPYIPSEVLEARLCTHRERELLNELPDKAV